ncbi:cytochrome P450 [Crepidotus variabilis]|uniref:Cytochrome P450 n=1 Tax=Crepidotus variabilis TaxID=179855 RepID=A0A9P6JT86_9AGAR|nr:cytochrome P450 [Crepidotus variabilis]
MATLPDLVYALFFSILAVYIYIRPSLVSSSNSKGLPYPPGPKPLPILGNVLDIKPKELWVQALRWAELYGPITHLSLLSSIHLVFINTHEAALELLEQKGGVYADKPGLVMCGDMCGCKNMVAFTPYGAQSKRQRRLLHKAFAAPVIPTYHPLLLSSTRGLLTALMGQRMGGKGMFESIKRYAGSITLSVVYGYEVKAPGGGSSTFSGVMVNGNANGASMNGSTPSPTSSPSRPRPTKTVLAQKGHGREQQERLYANANGHQHGNGHGHAQGGSGAEEQEEEERDPFLKMATECVNILSQEIASGGGIWLVDVFPRLRNIPRWVEPFPFMGFKAKARVWKKKMEDWVDGPWEWTLKSMKENTHKPSFCSTLLEDLALQNGEGVDQETKDNFEFDLKWTANSMYGASIDTTLTTLTNFIINMIQNPDAQRKAQEEIDRVLEESGDSDRLPTFQDRKNLVYCEALYKECLRWSASVPLSLPHRLMEDDIYKGMFIPKGSLVFANIWAMMRDPNVYPDPDAFKPERFLDLDGSGSGSVSKEEAKRMNPKNFVFGFGRRTCPGKELVESSVWLVIVSLLTVFSLSKAKDDEGNEQELKIEYENPIFRVPEEFGCDIRPRSERAVRLVQSFEELVGV